MSPTKTKQTQEEYLTSFFPFVSYYCSCYETFKIKNTNWKLIPLNKVWQFTVCCEHITHTLTTSTCRWHRRPHDSTDCHHRKNNYHHRTCCWDWSEVHIKLYIPVTFKYMPGLQINLSMGYSCSIDDYVCMAVYGNNPFCTQIHWNTNQTENMEQCPHVREHINAVQCSWYTNRL